MAVTSELIESQRLLHHAAVAARSERGKPYRLVAAFLHTGGIRVKGFEKPEEVTEFFQKRGIEEGNYVVVDRFRGPVIWMT